MIEFSRDWSMPNSDTFSVKPIGDFVKKYLNESEGLVSIDAFARNKDWFTYTNDLNKDTSAQYHMDAEEFLNLMHEKGIEIDLGILDPPYSPRQISECYKALGIKVDQHTTQTAAFYKKIKTAMDKIIKPNGIVLSFGWNTVGMGIKRGYEIIEIKLVCHGGAHNDTICLAERKFK